MTVDRRLKLCATTVLLLLGCMQASPPDQIDEAQDVDAIKAAFAGLVAVAEAGDADAYSTYITEDAMYLGPGAPAITGKEAIRSFVADFFADWTFSFPTWTTDEIVVAGDVAIHRYSGVAVLTAKAGADPIEEDRKYMDILRKTSDGRWLLARHMYNLNR